MWWKTSSDSTVLFPATQTSKITPTVCLCNETLVTSGQNDAAELYSPEASPPSSCLVSARSYNLLCQRCTAEPGSCCLLRVTGRLAVRRSSTLYENLARRTPGDRIIIIMLWVRLRSATRFTKKKIYKVTIKDIQDYFVNDIWLLLDHVTWFNSFVFRLSVIIYIFIHMNIYASTTFLHLKFGASATR